MMTNLWAQTFPSLWVTLTTIAVVITVIVALAFFSGDDK